MQSTRRLRWRIKVAMSVSVVLFIGMVPAAAHAQVDRGEVRIFAVNSRHPLRVDPIAVVTDGVWRVPFRTGTDAEREEWRAYYATRPTLYLFARNMRVGLATAVPATTPMFCFDITGRLWWESDRGSTPVPSVVAVTDSLFGGPPLARAPVNRERRALWEAIGAVANGHGVPDSLIERLAPAGEMLTLLTPEGEPQAVVGGVTATGIGTTDRGFRGDRLVAVFVILRAAGNAMDVQLEWTSDEVGDLVRSWELLEIMDLTRDGTAELIIAKLGYEGWHYEVLDQVGSEWEVIYRGGGGGC
jgi:hypothetical protein